VRIKEGISESVPIVKLVSLIRLDSEEQAIGLLTISKPVAQSDKSQDFASQNLVKTGHFH
jgi:hypothetical protein